MNDVTSKEELAKMIRKKKIVYVGLTVVFTVLIVISGSLPAIAWEKFPGVTIRTIAEANEMVGGALKRMAPYLEKATGIKLVVEMPPEDQIYDKIVMNASTHTGNYDLSIANVAWGVEFSQSGWLVPLDEYVAADPEGIGINDFIPAFLNCFRSPMDGKLYLIPLFADAQVVFYRKDWFKQFGMLPPKNNYEFVETAKFFTKSYNPDSPVEYATAEARSRGHGTHNMFIEILFPLGGDVIYGQHAHALPVPPGMAGKSALEHPIAIEAAKQFQWLSSRELGIMSPAVLNYGSFDLVRDFQYGLVALGDFWSICASNFQNPEISKVVGKVGYAPGLVWHGIFDKSIIGGRGSRVGGWGFGISVDSKHKEAAWETLKFLYGRENSKLLLECGTEAAKYSIYYDWELIQKYPWFPVTAKCLELARPAPLYPGEFRVEDILGRQLSLLAAMEITPEEAMKKASEEINALNFSKYHKK